ncbi:TadE/TadG family type IV pilus assembly protein [Lentilitoribacter sp. EG35]|uniref:TadE/TadG family type IV pilus assembly protein n=1 Tax=Lentilitoribacter sp. EG35 TaxID=3234192 RepID=UPI0034617474
MIDVAERRGIKMSKKPLKQNLIKLSKDKRGNFAMIAAITAPLLLAGGGLAVDLANQTALKTRFQAASDSVSLVVATRIANKKLTIADAPDFGKKLLFAQMTNDYSRFSNLKIIPEVTVTEVKNGGSSTWDVQVGGTATQDTTPFAKFLNKTTTSAIVASTAQSGQEIEQGALSMALAVDVSGSMEEELPTSTAEVEQSLGVKQGTAEDIIDGFEYVLDNYNLDNNDLKYIINNYTYRQCSNLNKKKAKRFLKKIGLSKWLGKQTARYICMDVTYATSVGVTANKLVNNLAPIIAASTATTKIDALKTAAMSLFAQFDEADKNHKYVRTGLSAYEYGVRETTKMEWGTKSAQSYVSKRMYANGGTASTNSIQWAFNQLKSKPGTEKKAHIAKNGQTNPDRFILFMTDGNNNRTSDDTNTKALCTTAKNDGIRVFTVAFAAPERGEKLLEFCASSPKSEHYFKPDTAAELIAAFKNIGEKTSPRKTRLTN